MDSIQVSAGVKKVLINEDPNRVVTFNPSDVLFAERYYAIAKEFEEKTAEFESKAKKLDTIGEDNAKEAISFLREVCEYMFEKIDALFGEGTSQTVFEGTLSLDMIAQFLTGISPFVQSARNEKVRKYAPKRHQKPVLK